MEDTSTMPTTFDLERRLADAECRATAAELRTAEAELATLLLEHRLADAEARLAGVADASTVAAAIDAAPNVVRFDLSRRRAS